MKGARTMGNNPKRNHKNFISTMSATGQVEISAVPPVTKKEIEVPINCPKCGIKLLLRGKGWGFCDNCTATITKE